MTLYSGEMSGKFDICKGHFSFTCTTAHKMKYQTISKKKKSEIFWSSEIIFQQPKKQNAGKKLRLIRFDKY